MHRFLRLCFRLRLLSNFYVRLITGLALFYTSRFIFKGQVTMEEIVFTLKRHWMTEDYEPFELYAIA